jgi:hypothetical protein
MYSSGGMRIPADNRQLFKVTNLADLRCWTVLMRYDDLFDILIL